MALIVQHPLIAAAQGKGQKQEMPIGDSSFLQNASYNSDTLQLTVTMKNGGQYVYDQVTPQIMQQFMVSRSKGKFYADFIRGKHESTRTITKTIGKPISTLHKKKGG